MTIGRIPSVEGGIQPTIVDAKGDLIAGVAADSVNRLAVGTNGTVLTADSSTSTGLAWTSVNQMANPVINGGMDVWQRGTSFAISNTQAYTADRWQGRTSAAVTSNFSRQTTNDTTNLPNIQYATRIQRASGQTGTPLMILETSLESVNSIPYAGKTVTFSFYARRGANFSGSSNQIVTNFMSGTGTDQNVASGLTGLTYVTNTTTTLNTTWTRYSYSGTISSAATQLAIQFYYTPTGTAGADDWYEITGVQIDLGTYTASTTPNFRRSGGTIQGELAACQRYYFRTVATGSYGTVVPISMLYDSTQAIGILTLPVTMRAAPTSVDFSSIKFFRYDDASYNISAVSLSTPTTSPQFVQMVGTISGGTAGWVGRWVSQGSTSSYLGVSAEL